MVSLINCMTSFFAGFTVFSMMGFMARLLKTEVGNAVKGGKSLPRLINLFKIHER